MPPVCQENAKVNPASHNTTLANLPPDLAAVIEVWPALPEHLKLTIKTLIESATTTKDKPRGRRK
jgi:hypothetical protein